MDPVHDRGSMDLVHERVLGPVPLGGSMDQGSMFCTFPVFTPLLSMMVSMSHNYYLLLTNSLFILILSEFHRGCLIWVKFVEILK